ncbi:MAG: hypothetical protein ABSF81_13440 [Bacteroidales bacterium]
MKTTNQKNGPKSGIKETMFFFKELADCFEKINKQHERSAAAINLVI